jgi:hypothetical protein
VSIDNDFEAETITRKAIELAKEGDLTALRLCLDRIAPPRKDRPVLFELPPITSAADAVQASGALVAAVAEGESGYGRWPTARPPAGDRTRRERGRALWVAGRGRAPSRS